MCIRDSYGASTTVGKVISKGDVVVYESTVYPGVTAVSYTHLDVYKRQARDRRVVIAIQGVIAVAMATIHPCLLYTSMYSL